MSLKFEKFLMEKINKTESFLGRLFHAIMKTLLFFLLIVFVLGIFNFLIGNF